MMITDLFVPAFVAGVYCSLLMMMCESEITPGERRKIVNFHNNFRASVIPSASNMEKMEWNEELALLAEGFAAKCVANSQVDHNPQSPYFESISRNFYVLSDLELEMKVNYSTIICLWFNESVNYDYEHNVCNGDQCGNYTRMVLARSNQLGCGSFYCVQPVTNIGTKGRFVVCNYGSEEKLDEDHRPYKQGVLCSNCPTGTSCDSGSDLCTFDTVDDPHFRVTLPSGHMFCYNIQGEQDAVYNLVSSKYLEMNAVFFVDVLNSSNSWIDSIGVTVFHKGQEFTQIKFSASAWEVNIGESVSLEASQVEKITVSKGRLMILPTYPKKFPVTTPSVEVHFSELNLDFSVHYTEFIDKDHSNKKPKVFLFWRSTEAIHPGAHGIVGQLLQEDVHIGEKENKLIIPEHASVSVTEIPAWKLHRDLSKERGDRRCWSTANRLIQGDVIKGTSVDYMVEDVFSTGFKFRGL